MTSSKSPPSRKPAPLPTTQELLDFINAAPEPVGKREIARAFGLRGADNKLALKQLLRQVQDQAGLHRSKRRLAPPGHAAHAGHTHAAVPDVMVVVVSGTDSDGELLARPVEWSGSGIPPRITLTPWRKGQDALGMGDKVLVRLRRAGRHAYDGEPIKVLEATQSRVLGLFEAMADGSGRIHPTSRKERADYLVPRGESGGAASGDLVIASPMPGRVYGLRPAKIDEVLGSIHAPRSASAIALYGNDIPDVFPAEAVAQAEAATAVPLGDRTDLRRIPLVTIDGEDARDFDDAVWATADDDPGNSGGWRCMVAIADVAWYVRPQDALDREAYRRGNSTYFPDRVVPMLPEALSNGWCSLVPHEDRGCMAVEFVIDRHGNKRSHRFCRGLMRSAARLTYDQVQRARDGQPDDTTDPLRDPVIAPLYGAWAALQEARKKRGVLELNLPERQVKLTPEGQVSQIVPRPQLESHRLIEDFMIQANVCAAEELERLNQPVMYRLHAEPDGEKLESLRDFLHSLDLNLSRGQKLTPQHFNTILARVADTPHAILVNEVILRAQAQAVYGPENIGHFGLGLARYAHFTSPIRRYADLLVHRALISGLNLGDGGLPAGALAHFADWGEQISMTERRSAAAEREAIDRYVTTWLADKVGATFVAKISGVTRFGLFITLEDSGADGLVPIRSLPDDYYVHDEKNHALVGKNSRRSFQLGQPVTVELIEANTLTGSMVFHLSGDHGPRHSRFRDRPHTDAKGGAKASRKSAAGHRAARRRR